MAHFIHRGDAGPDSGGRARGVPVRRSSVLAILLFACACNSTPQPEPASEDAPAAVPPMQESAPPVQEIVVYRTCDFAEPGALVALPREVPADLDPAEATMGELVRGVTEQEREQGCTSFFSARTENALRRVDYSERGDTLAVDFHNFSDAMPDAPGVTSFLPPGVMAELTWTIFRQFPGVDAVRFSFNGDERAYWIWVGGDGTEPQPFTRRMWEQI